METSITLVNDFVELNLLGTKEIKAFLGSSSPRIAYDRRIIFRSSLLPPQNGQDRHSGETTG